MKIDLTPADREILAHHDPSVHGRALIELAIVDALIEAAKLSKYRFEVDDLEQDEDASTDDGLKAALFNRDDALLNVYETGGPYKGWIKLVFGNDGWDLISDFSVNLEEFLASEPIKKVDEIWGGG